MSEHSKVFEKAIEVDPEVQKAIQKLVNEYNKGEISFIVGHWGNDEIVINNIANAIKQFGNTYYIINDNKRTKV